VFPRHSVLFIKETVGLKMPDGSAHDGYWYASDVGGAIKGARIDLFTGAGAASMKVLQALNLTTITAVKVGVFEGCPSTRSPTMGAKTPLPERERQACHDERTRQPEERPRRPRDRPPLPRRRRTGRADHLRRGRSRQERRRSRPRTRSLHPADVRQ